MTCARCEAQIGCVVSHVDFRVKHRRRTFNTIVFWRCFFAFFVDLRCVLSAGRSSRDRWAASIPSILATLVGRLSFLRGPTWPEEEDDWVHPNLIGQYPVQHNEERVPCWRNPSGVTRLRVQKNVHYIVYQAVKSYGCHQVEVKQHQLVLLNTYFDYLCIVLKQWRFTVDLEEFVLLVHRYCEAMSNHQHSKSLNG